MNNVKNKVIICVVFCMGLVSVYGFNYYIVRKMNYNYHVTLINLIEEYDLDIVDVLETHPKEDIDYSILNQYGIDLYDTNEFSSVSSTILLNSCIFIFYTTVILLLFILYRKKNNNRIKQLIYYIEEINQKNYSLDIRNNKEDTLSFLQNEIYKTMVYLNEVADLSLKDKKEIKKNLEDITHQIKTPLTAIQINLDNLLEDPCMEESMRTLMMRRVYKDTLSIQLLIENLLKLSKFDVNGVEFSRSDVYVNDLIASAIDKVAPVIDLYDVDVSYLNNDFSVYVDFHWQVEAISNIIKNACENGCTTLNIFVESNPVYTSIKIMNDGTSIDASDLRQIFDRFNSLSKQSGIGLALTKKIIELDQGMITVGHTTPLNSSKEQLCFTIKYFK